MINFWISAFLFPKGCLKRIQQLCSCFLWTGDVNKKAVAKVSWNTIFPKHEGGLGLRNLVTWNKTLSLCLVWLLFVDSSSSWVEWMKNNRLQGISFWEHDESRLSSSIWKSLLSLHQLAKEFIYCDIGNGRTASFWFDHWTSIGPLISRYGLVAPHRLGIPLYAKVSYATNSNGWLMWPARSHLVEQIHTLLTIIPTSMTDYVPDTYRWHIDNRAFVVFSTSNTWEVIRPRAQTKPWASCVWFRGATPKHAFLM